jgi:hypothetical protein
LKTSRSMTTGIAAFLIILISSSAFSQDNCDCRQSLSRLIDKMESEYPGFEEKTADTLRYEDFKGGLMIESENTGDSDCYDLLKRYLSYFRDGHVSLIQTNETQDPQAGKEAVAKADITLDDFYEHISGTDDELEGVWKSPHYKVGVIRANGGYQGFIIEASNPGWKAGEIKFRLVDGGEADYYMGDHSLEEGTFELFDGCILSIKDVNVVFVKESPEPKLTENEIESRLGEIQGFYFTRLTDRTSLLCISSFSDPYVERIEKMVSDNQEAIENCENLIIDVRNNLGGTYDAYDEILPYILTNQIRGVGQKFLVTQTLIDDVESWFDDEEGREMARRWISLFEGNIGKFINPDTSDISISEIAIAEHSPKHIAILVNKRTASSGEAFVLAAKQSKKVKILGVPTYGAIDYGSASLFEFGCPDYQLIMPTWRAGRLPDYPLDNIGIQPDIYLDKSVEDWVRFTVEYLES